MPALTPAAGLPGRSEEPFFQQPSTEKAITEIARADRLVIYVGAGATMSESGHSWRSMVELLFARLAQQHTTHAAIRESFDLPKRASIVREYFGRTEPGATAETIAHILRKALYQDAQWRSGDYTDAIALLCKAKLTAAKQITVVTSNYDQYLERALRKTSTAGLVRSIASPLTGDIDENSVLDELTPVDNDVLVVHFHGVILEHADPAQSEEIVLDEVDYLRTERLSSALLTRLFESNDVLVLGSSLEDDPLLRALWRTRGTRRRWAVFPRQNYENTSGAYGGHPHSYEDLIFAQTCRCKLFGLDVIAPDFFSQAAQFVREIAVASQGGYPQYSHTRRLETWWNSWFASRGPGSAQRSDHRSLSLAIPKIRKQLGGNGDEKLKLELWVHWKPSNDSGLQLWASSTGTWVDPTTMRNADIRVNSEYLAVRAFCTGVAQTHETNGKEHERWKRYLAVPIRVRADAYKIQAGVIVLATSATDAHSTIDERSKKRMNTLSSLLTDIGTKLLETDNPRSAA